MLLNQTDSIAKLTVYHDMDLYCFELIFSASLLNKNCYVLLSCHSQQQSVFMELYILFAFTLSRIYITFSIYTIFVHQLCQKKLRLHEIS